MSYKAQPNQLVPEGYDATVGAASTGADYNDIQTAITASKENILVLGDFTQTNNIITGADAVTITIAERLQLTERNITIGAGGLKIIGGIIKPTFTGLTSRLFTSSGLTTLELVGVYVDMSSATTANSGIASLFPNSQHLVHNCKLLLANKATAGFSQPSDGSIFTNLSVIGGGASCNDFIVNCSDTIIDNIHFSGTFTGSATAILVGGSVAKSSQISNITVDVPSSISIDLDEDKAQLSNISGNVDLNLTDASDCNISNCNLNDFSASSSSNNNKFANINTTGSTAITIDGDSNLFSKCAFNAAVTLGASSNDNQLFLCTSTGGFTDSGTDNSIVETIPNGKSLLIFGNNGIFNTTATRYLYAGASDSLAPTTIINMVMPFAATIKNMHVYHNTPAGNGSNIVYTLVKNGTPASLTVTIPSTTQTASDTSNSVSVVAGDRLAVQVTKAVTIGVSPSDIIVTMEIS
jgi:hypothetical protein